MSAAKPSGGFVKTGGVDFKQYDSKEAADQFEPILASLQRNHADLVEGDKVTKENLEKAEKNCWVLMRERGSW